MDPQSSYYDRGSFNPLIVVTIVLTILVLGAGGFGIWAYTNYLDQKNNVDQKVGLAVADAKRTQSETDNADFAQQEKQPTKQFVAPDDLGRVSFQFPKTWSGYVDKPGTGSGSYEAYFRPGTVPPLGSGTPYALRITIQKRPYEATLATFQDAVKKGDVTSTTVTVNGQVGNRLAGKIETGVVGVMILLKIRDTTLMVYTESPSFQSDFDKIIIPSLTFNS